MRDGKTTRIRNPAGHTALAEFLARYRASLVMLSGAASGAEFVLSQECVSVGRGPGVDLAVDNSTMSRKHVLLEFARGGYRIRDVGSTNGVRVNGTDVQVANLKRGDRIEMGDQVFQYLLEKRESARKQYVLPDS
jgi:pSer/pThr/pTyr-binding forkhead associated (FHA) protein